MRTLLIHLAAAALAAAKTPVFETSDAAAAGSVTGFEFKKRVVVPYGVGDAFGLLFYDSKTFIKFLRWRWGCRYCSWLFSSKLA